MTIKKRLFISNILMIVIPILLSLAFSLVFINIMTTLLGIQDLKNTADDDFFNDTVKNIKSLSVNLDLNSLIKEVQTFGLQDNKKVSLAVYRQKDCVYSVGGTTSGPVYENLLEQNVHGYYTYNSAFYIQPFDKYTVYIMNADFNAITPWQIGNSSLGSVGYGIVIFSSLVLIIFFTNRFLTKFVFRHIVTPLNVLVDGVHEIRDGNLNYRIQYQNNDEFNPACKDFNEMAEQISLLVKEKQKDDENRCVLIAGISHDLRTPLTSIKACAEGLIVGVASSPKQQKEYLEAIINKTDDLSHIVSQLFLFSKLDVGEFPFSFKKVNIGEELLDFILSISAEYQQKGLNLIFEENINNKFVNIDMAQFRSVIINIIENTLKYGNMEHNEIRIHSRQEESNVIITMTDNGPGVPNESLNKLFSVFYRDDKSRNQNNKGSGLGLAISSKIVENFGGRIYAENSIEGGLSIIISLPMVPGGNYEENTDY